MSINDRRIRPMVAADLPFIHSSHLGYTWPLAWGTGPKDTFMATEHRRTELVLSSPNVVSLVMCGVPDDDWIMGWLLGLKHVSEGKVQFQLFSSLTKREHRGEKVFRTLLQHASVGCTDLRFVRRGSQIDAWLESHGFKEVTHG